MAGYFYSGTIEECTNNGKIKGGCASGGIAGIQSENCIVKNCTNKGEIFVEANDAGGIIGRQNGTVEACINNGTITSKAQKGGGITGRMYCGKIKNCSNSGLVQSNGDKYNGSSIEGASGGIVGVVDLKDGKDVEITKVYNLGKIKIKNEEDFDNDCVGGIIGKISKGKEDLLKYAYNKGELDGGDYIGAIVGDNEISESVSDCYYYLPDGSGLAGIGGSSQTGETYFSGTEGNTNYKFNSLEEFLNNFNISLDDNE